MSNPTTPFGWQMPTNTDLVTDLPADFEVFGQAVATDLQYLLGGTTGQVLAKASGTDLDFDWVTDATGMINPMTTTSDMIYSSSGSTPARIGVGSAGQVLTVTAGVPGWATPAGGGKVLQVVSAISDVRVSTTTSATAYTFTDVSGFTATITPTSATSKVMVLVQVSVFASTDQANRIYLRLMRNSTAISVGTGGTGVQCSASTFTNSNIARHSDNTPINFVDSPATTSATTYKIQVTSNGTSNTVRFNGGNAVDVADGLSTTQIILMEIGA